MRRPREEFGPGKLLENRQKDGTYKPRINTLDWRGNQNIVHLPAQQPEPRRCRTLRGTVMSQLPQCALLACRGGPERQLSVVDFMTQKVVNFGWLITAAGKSVSLKSYIKTQYIELNHTPCPILHGYTSAVPALLVLEHADNKSCCIGPRLALTPDRKLADQSLVLFGQAPGNPAVLVGFRVPSVIDELIEGPNVDIDFSSNCNCSYDSVQLCPKIRYACVGRNVSLPEIKSGKTEEQRPNSIDSQIQLLART